MANDKPQTLMGKPIVYEDSNDPIGDIVFGDFEDIALKAIAERYEIPVEFLKTHVRYTLWLKRLSSMKKRYLKGMMK